MGSEQQGKASLPAIDHTQQLRRILGMCAALRELAVHAMAWVVHRQIALEKVGLLHASKADTHRRGEPATPSHAGCKLMHMPLANSNKQHERCYQGAVAHVCNRKRLTATVHTQIRVRGL